MKKILIILLAVILSFAGISSISASDNLIKTDTKDKVIFIQDENGKFSYSWSFDKEEYEKNAFDFDMSIGFNSPFKNDIEKLISKNMKKEYVSFNYHGDLPSTATIKVPVSKFKDEQMLNLYYYDDTTYEKVTAISKLDEKNLKQLAEDMKIDYIQMSKTSNMNYKLSDIKKQISDSQTNEEKINSYQDIYYYFAIPLVILLLIDFTIRKRSM